MFISVPTFDCKTAIRSHTEYATREDWLAFLWSVFKTPGKYQFDEDSSKVFQSESIKFNKTGIYCTAPLGSADYRDYWDYQKDINRNGIIIHGSSGVTWFLTRYYYMWINFLPIYDKEEAKFGFAKIRDAQYHMALYEDIARYSFKHAGILKKRQIASSYYHMGVIINNYWFEPGFINKMAASLKDYINEKGSWRFLEEYRNFLNEHTAWYRPSNPDKVLNWEQKIEVNMAGKKIDKGNKSTIMGSVLDKDPTNGVGGPCGFFFHEEAGIAPKMNITLEYLMPAMKSGMVYTGWFAVAGSVGDLDQCEPLKQIILNPKSKDILAIGHSLLNKEGEYAETGLFIPEQWSMPPCIDDYGNSLVELALEMILEERKTWEKELSPEDYQLRISQKPTNIEEAFAYRKRSRFPLHLINAQIRRIQDKQIFMEYLDIDRDESGKPIFKETRKLPIMEFPVSPKTQDKEGVVVVYERPKANPEFGTYLGSIDPVSEGKTTTSESLCSIYIYKTTQEVTRQKSDGTMETYLEHEKIVASWCGRFDDLKRTHERLELLIEMYNAWTIIENNISLFIQYMISKRKQKYLVPKDQIMFLKELSANANVYQEYGWKNTGTIFKTNLLSYGIDYLTEELDHETKPDGTIVKTVYGIERIPDIMLLREMAAYVDGLNVDRLIAFTSLVTFAKIQYSNKGYSKRREQEDGSLQKPSNYAKLSIRPFRNIGGNQKGVDDIFKRRKSAFRNYK